MKKKCLIACTVITSAVCCVIALLCCFTGFGAGKSGGHTHKMIPVAEKSATCTKDGHGAYYMCVDCEKWFEDGEGTEEITDRESVVFPKGHKMTPVDGRNATCTEDGNKAYYTCTVCDKWFEDSDGKTEIIDKSGVVIEKVPHKYKDNVCTECGIHASTEGLIYTDMGNYAEVSGIGDVTDREIVIAEEYNGKPVTSIGYEAFSGCYRLTSVVLPDSITSIGEWAFEDCYSLTNIKIPESVTYIGKGAFIRCKSFTSVEIPAGVTSIKMSAFEECIRLESVTIYGSVTSIGESAFAYCDSLSKIIFGGTKERWEEVNKGTSWDFGSESYTVYCTNGELKKDY